MSLGWIFVIIGILLYSILIGLIVVLIGLALSAAGPRVRL